LGLCFKEADASYNYNWVRYSLRSGGAFQACYGDVDTQNSRISKAARSRRFHKGHIQTAVVSLL
jgi:hypothetical protein